ncbi:unnamed protein product [Coffea canephora]|uniref:DH200=94 genomic scaffold, scaffold_212 n=1 Tax=Coffea canephora TaxID=49390 RepID=A0A068VC30_COFCA|nr:unnamed protein product [Coffea canephora]
MCHVYNGFDHVNNQQKVNCVMFIIALIM